MRTASKKPRKQRKYQYTISKNEAHKLMTAPLSKKLRDEKGFRNLPVREGDNVKIVRGQYKGRSGRVTRTDPQNQKIMVDGIVNKKTDSTEIPVPIHPSNVVIEKYNERDRARLELINRRIKDEEQKIDIESVLAAAEAEEAEEVIDMDDEFEDIDEELLDEELVDEDFELIDEDLEDEDLEDEDLDEELLDEDLIDEDLDVEEKEES